MDKFLDVTRFNLADTAIAEMNAQYMALKVAGVDDDAGCKLVHDARMVVKRKRIQVEKKRVELQAEARDYVKAVNGEARRIRELLEPIESHLDAQERIVTDEAKRIAAAKVEEERARIKVEDERLAKERAVMQEQQAKADAEAQLERDRLAAIAAEQQAKADALAEKESRIAKEEADRQHAIKVEEARVEAAKQAKADAEREAEETKQREADEKKAAEAEAARREALKPDMDKIIEYGRTLNAIPTPEMTTSDGEKYLDDVVRPAFIKVLTYCKICRATTQEREA